MSEQIKHDYIKKIQDLYEVDIGDFKRKIITILNRWEEDLSDDLNQPPSLKDFFQRIRTSVICNDTTEIDTIRTQVIKRIKSHYKIN